MLATLTPSPPFPTPTNAENGQNSFAQRLLEREPLVTCQEVEAHLLLLKAFLLLVVRVEGKCIKEDPSTGELVLGARTHQLFQDAVWRFYAWQKLVVNGSVDVTVHCPVRGYQIVWSVIQDGEFPIYSGVSAYLHKVCQRVFFAAQSMR